MAEAKAASMFEVTLITESANHKRYRVSLRSSSKRVPSNPSPNGVGFCPSQKERPHGPSVYVCEEIKGGKHSIPRPPSAERTACLTVEEPLTTSL